MYVIMDNLSHFFLSKTVYHEGYHEWRWRSFDMAHRFENKSDAKKVMGYIRPDNYEILREEEVRAIRALDV